MPNTKQFQRAYAKIVSDKRRLEALRAPAPRDLNRILKSLKSTLGKVAGASSDLTTDYDRDQFEGLVRALRETINDVPLGVSGAFFARQHVVALIDIWALLDSEEPFEFVELADDLTTACRLLAEELPDIIEIVKTNDPRSFKTKNLLISIESQYRRMYGEWPTSSDGGKEGSFPNFLQKLADLSNLANDGAFSPHDVRTLSRAFHDRPRRKT